MTLQRKIFLLLIYYFLFIAHTNAEVIGGYDRQRLMLKFQSILEQHYRAHPLVVNQSLFPTEIDESADTDARRLYDVLSEEGLLQRDVVIHESEGEGALITRGFRYRLRENRPGSRIVMGLVDVLGIDRWQTEQQPESSQILYQVSFRWQLSQPAPWLWAPSLRRNDDLAKLLNTLAEPTTGQAVFGWRENQWQLQSTDL